VSRLPLSDDLAPQVGFEPTTLRLSAEGLCVVCTCYQRSIGAPRGGNHVAQSEGPYRYLRLAQSRPRMCALSAAGLSHEFQGRTMATMRSNRSFEPLRTLLDMDRKGAGQSRTRLSSLLRLGSTFGMLIIGGFSAFWSGNWSWRMTLSSDL
jgi:hypothetical protein